MDDREFDDYETLAPPQREEAPDPVVQWEELRRQRRERALGVLEEPSESVGRSPLAQDLSSTIDGLVVDHSARRRAAEQRAAEDSQGYSEGSLSQALTTYFGRTTGGESRGLLGDLGRLTPDQQWEAAQAELETAQRTAPMMRGVAQSYPLPNEMADMRRDPHMTGIYPPGELPPVTRFGGDQLTGSMEFFRRLYGAEADKQEARLRRAQAMLRGEAPLPQLAQWRSLFETGARTIPDLMVAMPIQYLGILYGGAAAPITGTDPIDTHLFRFGQEVERIAQAAFPGDRARQFEFANSLAQGVASTATFAGSGALATLLGAGARGRIAVIALTGAAAETPGEFLRVTEALRRGDATERDRIISVLANTLGGASEVLPFMPGGGGRPGIIGFGGRFLRGGVDEAMQETGQGLIRNSARLSYDDQNVHEGLLEGALVAFLSGGLFHGVMRRPDEITTTQQPPVQEARVGGRSSRTQPAPPATAPVEPPQRSAPAESGQTAPPEPVIQRPAERRYSEDDFYGLDQYSPVVPLMAQILADSGDDQ